MDEVLKTQENTSEVVASDAQSLAEMPSFEEHMTEIKEVNGKGTVGVEALISEPVGDKKVIAEIQDTNDGTDAKIERELEQNKKFEAVEKAMALIKNTHEESEEFKNFKNNHPDIAQKMIKIGTPLDANNFHKLGFSFYNNKYGKTHIRRETGEYRKWKKEHPDEMPPINMRKYAPMETSEIMENGNVWDEKRNYESSVKLLSNFDFGELRLLRGGERRALENVDIDPDQINDYRVREAKNLIQKSPEKEVQKQLERIMNNAHIEWYDYTGDEKYLPIINPYTFGKNKIEDALLLAENKNISKNLLLRDLAAGIKDGYVINEKTGRWNSTIEMAIPATKQDDPEEWIKKLFKKCEVDKEYLDVQSAALAGFVNVLKSRNGEKTDWADWYFETFDFAKNWDSFLSEMQAVGEEAGVGFKRKLTMFLNRRGEWAERNEKIKEEKEARKLASKNAFARLGNMRKVDRGYIDAYIDTLREDANLDDNYFPFKDFWTSSTQNGNIPEENANTGGTLNGATANKQYGYIHNNRDPRYGKMKMVKLGDWGAYIQDNVDPNADFYIESVGIGNEKVRSNYLALQFTVGDKTYCIAESIRDNEGMYLASGEAGEDIREYFRALSKREARKDDHVEVIYHLDKENFGDSLDQCYAKAFFLLFGGKKSQKDFGKVQVFPVGAGFADNSVGE